MMLVVEHGIPCLKCLKLCSHSCLTSFPSVIRVDYSIHVMFFRCYFENAFVAVYILEFATDPNLSAQSRREGKIAYTVYGDGNSSKGLSPRYQLTRSIQEPAPVRTVEWRCQGLIRVLDHEKLPEDNY
jgi:hypothetical protein